MGPAVPDPKFDWTEIPEALRLLDDGGVSAISSYIFIDGVSPHARMNGWRWVAMGEGRWAASCH